MHSLLLLIYLLSWQTYVYNTFQADFLILTFVIFLICISRVMEVPEFMSGWLGVEGGIIIFKWSKRCPLLETNCSCPLWPGANIFTWPLFICQLEKNPTHDKPTTGQRGGFPIKLIPRTYILGLP